MATESERKRGWGMAALLLLFSLGLFASIWTLAPPDWVPFLGVLPLLLFVSGGVLLLRTLRSEPPKLRPVPAEVSFRSKTRHEVPPPPSPPLPPLPSAKPVDPSPPPLPLGRPPELSKIEEAIRDISRRISQANVMLGTGRLSPEGYDHYVGELKEEKAKLEAERIRLLLREKP